MYFTYDVVISDSVTHKLKGKTVMNEKERYESLRHCKWVDEVIEDAPWVIDEEFMQKHKVSCVPLPACLLS